MSVTPPHHGRHPPGCRPDQNPPRQDPRARSAARGPEAGSWRVSKPPWSLERQPDQPPHSRSTAPPRRPEGGFSTPPAPPAPRPRLLYRERSRSARSSWPRSKITQDQLAEALDAQQKAPKLRGRSWFRRTWSRGGRQPSRGEAEAHAGAGVEQNDPEVDTKRLDSVLDLVDELVLGRNRLAKIQAQFEGRNRGRSARDRPGRVSSPSTSSPPRPARRDEDRMLTQIRRVFSKFPRMVRDLGRAKGKDIEIRSSARRRSSTRA